MAGKHKPLIVIGHKNPDTDSICSAVAYARFKTEVAGEEAQARRAGNVNPQTQFVLSRFETESPHLATDVRARLEDVMIPSEQLVRLTESDTVEKACDLLTANNFSFLPVVQGKRYVGMITALKLVGVLRHVAAGCRDGVELEKSERDLLAGTIGALLEREHRRFRPDDHLRDVVREIRAYNEGGFVIEDQNGDLCGVVTRKDFIGENRLKVVLVDHNEVAQAVDGIEEAEVVEILDHHRLAARTTALPITFINRVVGSTCTIIADMYRTSGVTPPARDAGLLLSGMLSDTVVLRSPTTTRLDRDLAGWLAGLSKVDIEAYGHQMFAAGSSLEGMDARKIIRRDQKVYTEGRRKFSLSQFETVGFSEILEMKDVLAEELERIIDAEKCSFACLMITDVTRETSLLLCRGEARVINAIAYPKREDQLFLMKDVLSRKKQVLPYFVDLLQTL
jgi:manganese-dependent inorganic pyrophosphatase